jgi:hypothetical protein
MRQDLIPHATVREQHEDFEDGHPYHTREWAGQERHEYRRRELPDDEVGESHRNGDDE